MRAFVLLVCATVSMIVLGVVAAVAAGDDAVNHPLTTAVTLPNSWAMEASTLSSADGGEALFGGIPDRGSSNDACYRADLVPGSDVIRSLVTGSCDDPQLFPYGGKVTFVTDQIGTSHLVNVRISHLTKSGHVVLSQVVMTFHHYSDTQLVPAYGNGELWLYDVSTLKGAVLLGVSANTGRVLQSVHMPQLWRPVVAVNDDGIFLAGTDGPADIYQVSSGALRPTLLYSGFGSVSLLAASGHRLLASLLSGREGAVSMKTFITHAG